VKRPKIICVRQPDGTWTGMRGPAVDHGYKTKRQARRAVRRVERMRRAER